MTRGRRRKERTVDPANVFGRVLSPDTGRELSSVHFTDFRSSDTDPRSEEPNTMTGRVYPLGIVCPRRSFGENGGNSTLEPYVGQEFDTSDEARDFYNMYANYLGFKMRVGQLYRSRVDGSVSNRRFVCSKEGFQINSRTGCPAFVRVKKCDSGKWMFDQFAKDHNHDLEPSAENDLPVLQCKSPFTNGSTVQVGRKPRNKIPSGIDDGQRCPSSVVNVKRIKLGVDDGQAGVEPTIGLEFNTASEAYQFYNMFAMKAGFRVRIGQLFRSKLDGSVTSRRFVCSKEGFQHPSRVGCGAFMRIKRQDSGRWVVDRYQVQHNHELEAQIESARSSASRKLVEEESNGGFEKNSSTALVNISHGRPRKVHRSNNIENDWYPVLLDYFQAKQAEEMGFFYAVEMQMGRSRNLFWADRRSRFACTQFGDAIVFDTSYRSGAYLVPLATFTGVNHHKQPVLLGCALLADESKESFAWLFQTWMKSMSGRRPKSIIADQDKAIREAISSVFPGTHHRFSMWQIKEKERELLSTVNGEFKYEYDRCIFQSQTTGEFDSAWTALLHKYGLRDNTWLNEMYEYRENWVPLYLRGTFFAGIPFSGLESFFGTFLNAQTPLADFIGQYEQTLEQRREDERKEDYNSFNLQAFLQTEEPVEEQCRRLYTLVMFKVFQKELMQSYSYLGSSIYEEGTIARYLIRKCGNEPEKHIVTFNASNLEVSCGCQMFESEGMLCRHVLRLFQSLDVREIPSRYILHRWTRNAEYGIVRDLDSGGGNSPQELKAMMTWSLREMASKYIESGTTSFDKYKLAFELMRDGGRKLSWQR